jgi:radical SAM superfamily enzyme YgiQ (UPF0313 family)
MKFYIVNLPSKHKIIRRYSCSYYANGFLYPPIELLRVTTIIKNNYSLTHQIKFTDAVAEGLSASACIADIRKFDPDVVITLISVDFINEETEFLTQLRSVSKAKIIGIGYLPDLFRDQFPQFDVILGNNFEEVIQAAAGIDSTDSFIQKMNDIRPVPMTFNPDIIEGIDYSFLKKDLYFEFLTKGATAFTYFSFGCPYKCSFCIRTYNLDKAHYRNFENIKKELLHFHEQGYHNIRIMDDNCTLHKGLLKDMLRFIEENNLRFNFYGLTRVDLLDEETAQLLKALHFKRIFLGLESIYQDVQKAYNKNINTGFDFIREKILTLSRVGIEVSVFLLFNPLTEGKKEILESLSFIKKLPVLFANISYLIPYPETEFYEKNIDNITLTTSPVYSVAFKENKVRQKKWVEYYFLFSFYIFNRHTFFNTLSIPLKYPQQFLLVVKSIFAFMFKKSDNRDDFI